MGLLREGNNMAIRVLDTVGIDPKKMYSSVVQKINEGPRAAANGSMPVSQMIISDYHDSLLIQIPGKSIISFNKFYHSMRNLHHCPNIFFRLPYHYVEFMHPVIRS